MTIKRHTKQEILELYKACQAKLGEPPGIDRFCRMAKLKPSEISYYWPRPTALTKEVGAIPNEFGSKLPDEVVFQDYTRVCLHLGKIPTQTELRIAQRELETKTSTVYDRHGDIYRFQDCFRKWLLERADEQLKAILQFDGWARVKSGKAYMLPSIQAFPQLHPFLPSALQYLDVLARGDMPPYETSDVNVSTLFERRTSDAFRCLGFEMRPLGQGTGRNPDAIALATKERFAILIDAKVRVNGYALGTEDRKFLEYALTHGKELQRQGIEKVYLVVVGPSFRESDLKRLTEYLSESPARSVDMITATALIRIVEESIRERSAFTLSTFEKQLFGNKIISS
jgi:hypothetical protein